MGLFYLTDTYDKVNMVLVVVGCATLLAGGITIPYCIITNKNDTKKALEELNTKIERDLDVESFSAKSIVFDKTNENFLIKITGSSPETSYLAAKYKVSEQDYYNLQSGKSDVIDINKQQVQFIKNITDVLNRSEFLEKDEENLALASNEEIILNVSKPYMDEETNSMNYNLTIAKLKGNDLKLGTFAVSTPLTETLKENPKEIYAMSSEKVEVEKLEVKTYKNVAHVEMYDDYTLIV